MTGLVNTKMLQCLCELSRSFLHIFYFVTHLPFHILLLILSSICERIQAGKINLGKALTVDFTSHLYVQVGQKPFYSGQ